MHITQKHKKLKVKKFDRSRANNNDAVTHNPFSCKIYTDLEPNRVKREACYTGLKFDFLRKLVKSAEGGHAPYPPFPGRSRPLAKRGTQKTAPNADTAHYIWKNILVIQN